MNKGDRNLTDRELNHLYKLRKIIDKELVTEDVDYLSFCEQVSNGHIANEASSWDVWGRYLKQYD